MTKCKLKNGAEASLDLAKKIFNQIKALIEQNDNKIIDEKNNLLLKELLNKADNDQHVVVDAVMKEMIKIGLLQSNGLNQEEKNIIQSCLFLDDKTIFVQNPIAIPFEIDLNGENTDIDQFLKTIFH